MGGQGDKLFPPTYPGATTNSSPRHVFERRRINGTNTLCVLVDSVQSQANRLEESLKTARDRRDLAFPVLAVDFSQDLPDLGLITALEAPHRVFDAIFRDSEIDGQRFNKSELYKAIVTAKPQFAQALFEIAPTALVFGAWNSTGEGGGLGAKFPRTVVSEIIGIGVATETRGKDEEASGKRTGSRLDPLGIRAGIKVYETDDGWSLDKPNAKAKELKPSEINHSNIAPTVADLGVSVDYLQHTFVLSFSALRRLHFGNNEASSAARAALAALGLASVAYQDDAGYFLRSRCDLIPDAGPPAEFEIVNMNGTTTSFSLTSRDMASLVNAAAKAAVAAGVGWKADDIVLKPQRKLVDLVKRSRALALEGQPDNTDVATV